MINASDLIFYGNKNILKVIKKIFPQKDPKIEFVRIACHSFEVEKNFTSNLNTKKKL